MSPPAMPSRRHRKRSDWARSLPVRPSDCYYEPAVSDSSTSSSSPTVSYECLPPHRLSCFPSSSSSSSSTSSRLRSPIRSRRHTADHFYLNNMRNTPNFYTYPNPNNTPIINSQQQPRHQHQLRRKHHGQSSISEPLLPLSLSECTLGSSNGITSKSNHRHVANNRHQHHASTSIRRCSTSPPPPPIVDVRRVSFSEYTAAELPDLAFLFRSFLPPPSTASPDAIARTSRIGVSNRRAPMCAAMAEVGELETWRRRSSIQRRDDDACESVQGNEEEEEEEEADSEVDFSSCSSSRNKLALSSSLLVARLEFLFASILTTRQSHH